jgi:hypothetical protein
MPFSGHAYDLLHEREEVEAEASNCAAGKGTAAA